MAGESVPPSCPPIRPLTDGKHVHSVAFSGNTTGDYPPVRAQQGDTQKPPENLGFSSPDIRGQEILTGSGARTRTADTWIMIPLRRVSYTWSKPFWPDSIG